MNRAHRLNKPKHCTALLFVHSRLLYIEIQRKKKKKKASEIVWLDKPKSLQLCYCCFTHSTKKCFEKYCECRTFFLTIYLFLVVIGFGMIFMGMEPGFGNEGGQSIKKKLVQTKLNISLFNCIVLINIIIYSW